MIPADILAYIEVRFTPAERDEAIALIESAVLPKAKPADDRCRRCALVASHGDMTRLAYGIERLRVDFRDVIVAGEYETVNGKLMRVRNLDEPITADLLQRPK